MKSSQRGQTSATGVPNGAEIFIFSSLLDRWADFIFSNVVRPTVSVVISLWSVPTKWSYAVCAWYRGGWRVVKGVYYNHGLNDVRGMRKGVR